MKGIREQASLFVTVLALLGIMFLTVPKAAAQQDSPPAIGDADDNFNPPPCDYNDTFYMDNGILPDHVQGRFGDFRQFGPPARSSSQANWVADSDCSATDPVRRDFRILATTGGYIDDNSGNATDFISLIGFLTDQGAFETSYTRSVGTIAAGGGSTISIDSNGQNPRGIALQDIVGNFEAYPALKQTVAGGVLAPTPCGSMLDPNVPANTPCFSVASVATPNLRQDWRFASNRNAIDGSDGNCINNDPTVCPGGINDAPFGYFCDDLLGIWINTYFWFTHHAVGNPATGEQPDPICTGFMNQLIQMHGKTLDGTGVITTADELNFLEGSDVSPGTPFGPGAGSVGPSFADGEGCAAEGQLDTGGADAPGAVWDICPTIPDPRAGAIALDAFLDTVRFPSGAPVDFRFNLNFACLKVFGLFCSELTSTQMSSSTLQSTASTD